MSIQLIVYPQSFEGIPNAISGNSSQMVANPTDFTNAMTTLTDYSATTTIAQVAVNDIASTMAPNSWYGYVNTSTSAFISATNNMLLLNPPDVGVLQKLTNLTIGSVYNVTLTFDSLYPNPVDVKIFNGTTFVSSVIATPSALTATVQFTAQSVNNTIFCLDGISSVVAITSVSITSATPSPSGAINVLSNGQVICDLYEDEDIPLTLSVDDFKNVAEKVQSYSKAFNLPATKRNNQIFDNIFEITRSDDGIIFNPYKKTQCVLKQDGFILFEGYLRMLDVTDKEGEISYNVNLYSEAIALADVLKDRDFRELDFTELEHDYNKTQIKYSWNDAGTGITYTNPSTSGFRDANSTLKYPFVNWTSQISFSSFGNPVLSNLETAFRPFISIKYLIDRIFNAPNTPFTYESDFFNTTDFKKLYMDFNWGAEENGSQPYVNNYLFQGDNAGSNYWINETSYNAASKLRFNTTFSGNNAYWNNTNYKYVSPVSNLEVNCEYYIKLESDASVSSYSNSVRIAKFSASGNLLEVFAEDNNSIVANGSKYLQGTLSTILQANEYIQAQSYSLTADKIRMSNDTIGGYASWLEFDSSNEQSLVSTLLTRIRGELGQWDFLKGLMTMFNLVSLPDKDNPNNIIFEPYSDVFIPTATTLNPLTGNTLANRGVQHDWTDKIDVSKMKLEPLTDLNKKTIFKFVEDDDDSAFEQYKNLVGGHLYGSKKYDASEFTILDGEDEIVAEPFAATVVKPLMPQFSDFITPAIYSMNEDGTSEGFENSPRIMYDNGIKLTGASYYIPAQNGLGSEYQPYFLQFSHLTDIPTIQSTPSVAGSKDFHFGICQLMTNVGAPVPDNLFNLYWLPYYSELYNPNTRIMTIKVNLSPADINTFKFNDKVFIKNRVFRVNKIDYKPNDLATVEFILIP